MSTAYGGVTVPPAERLPLEATAATVGEVVLKVIKGLPETEADVDLAQSMNRYREYLAQIGFKKAAQFEKKASTASVRFDGDSYEVIRYVKGDEGGFAPASSVKLPLGTAAEAIGAAVLAAFSNTQGA